MESVEQNISRGRNCFLNWMFQTPNDNQDTSAEEAIPPSAECVVVAGEVQPNDEELATATPVHVIQSSDEEVSVIAHEVGRQETVDEQNPTLNYDETRMCPYEAYECVRKIIANEWGRDEEVYIPPSGISVLNDKDIMIMIQIVQRMGIQLKGVFYTSPDVHGMRHAWKPYYQSVINSMNRDKFLDMEALAILKFAKWRKQYDASTALPAEVIVQMPEELQQFPSCFPCQQFTVERKEGTFSGTTASCCDNKQCCLEDHYFTEKVGIMALNCLSTIDLLTRFETPEKHRAISKCIVDYYIYRAMYSTKKVVGNGGNGITELHDLCEFCVMKYAVAN